MVDMDTVGMMVEPIMPRQEADMQKKLKRSRGESMIAGVCGGIADYLDIDATLVRLVFVLLALLGGHGLLVYLILWIIMPRQRLEDAVREEQTS